LITPGIASLQVREMGAKAPIGGLARRERPDLMMSSPRAIAE
jgi:hypothetical protein